MTTKGWVHGWIAPKHRIGDLVIVRDRTTTGWGIVCDIVQNPVRQGIFRYKIAVTLRDSGRKTKYWLDGIAIKQIEGLRTLRDFLK